MRAMLYQLQVRHLFLKLWVWITNHLRKETIDTLLCETIFEMLIKFNNEYIFLGPCSLAVPPPSPSLKVCNESCHSDSASSERGSH